MAEHKTFITPLSKEQPGDKGEGAVSDNSCDISEGQFPCIGKCCSEINTISGAAYKKICRYCSIWASLPDSTSLEVTNILECVLCGYGKRLKE